MQKINSHINTHNIVMCANMFVRKDGKILVLKRSQQKKIAPGYFHPAGGKVDPNEEPLQAAKRELMEEAGISVKNIKLEAIITEIEPHNPGENWLIFHFSGDYEDGEVKETPEGEFMWLTKDELVNSENLFPSVKELIKYIVDETKGTAFASFVYTNCKDDTAALKDLEIGEVR